MRAPSSSGDWTRRVIQVAILVPAVWAIGRLVLILPRWINGEAPAYPGQFAGHLRFAVVMTCLAAWVLIQQSVDNTTRRGKMVSRLAAALAIAVVALDMALSRN